MVEAPAERKQGHQRSATHGVTKNRIYWHHWSTFERLTAQHDAFVQVSLAGMAAKLNLLGESLDDWV